MSRKSQRERHAAFAVINQATDDMKRAAASPKGLKQGLREQAKTRRHRWYHDATLPVLAVLAIVGAVFGLHYADAKVTPITTHPAATSAKH